VCGTLPLPRFTERTITDRQLLASELDRIASHWLRIDNEEYVLGVACVAVPVRITTGEVIARGRSARGDRAAAADTGDRVRPDAP